MVQTLITTKIHLWAEISSTVSLSTWICTWTTNWSPAIRTPIRTERTLKIFCSTLKPAQTPTWRTYRCGRKTQQDTWPIIQQIRSMPVGSRVDYVFSTGRSTTPGCCTARNIPAQRYWNTFPSEQDILHLPLVWQYCWSRRKTADWRSSPEYQNSPTPHCGGQWPQPLPHATWKALYAVWRCKRSPCQQGLDPRLNTTCFKDSYPNDSSLVWWPTVTWMGTLRPTPSTSSTSICRNWPSYISLYHATGAFG